MSGTPKQGTKVCQIEGLQLEDSRVVSLACIGKREAWIIPEHKEPYLSLGKRAQMTPEGVIYFYPFPLGLKLGNISVMTMVSFFQLDYRSVGFLGISPMDVYGLV